MPVFIDQTGRSVSINSNPQRIISLVPSQTELLFDLGLADQVIGITKFCIHPDKWVSKKIKIGGTKQINIDQIMHLQPDLIFANKEENEKNQIEELEKIFPVWTSDVNNFDDACEMIEQIGLITNKQQPAFEMIYQIRQKFAQLPSTDSRLRTIYLIWQNPYMAVGADTFIHSMLEAAGFYNIFDTEKRYPEVTLDNLQTRNCELLLLSSEPYPFKQKHIDEIQKQLPDSKILLVDGEIFSWYGSRMLQAPKYFMNLRQQIK